MSARSVGDTTPVAPTSRRGSDFNGVSQGDVNLLNEHIAKVKAGVAGVRPPGDSPASRVQGLAESLAAKFPTTEGGYFGKRTDGAYDGKNPKGNSLTAPRSPVLDTQPRSWDIPRTEATKAYVDGQKARPTVKAESSLGYDPLAAFK